MRSAKATARLSAVHAPADGRLMLWLAGLLLLVYLGALAWRVEGEREAQRSLLLREQAIAAAAAAAEIDRRHAEIVGQVGAAAALWRAGAVTPDAAVRAIDAQAWVEAAFAVDASGAILAASDRRFAAAAADAWSQAGGQPWSGHAGGRGAPSGLAVVRPAPAGAVIAIAGEGVWAVAASGDRRLILASREGVALAGGESGRPNATLSMLTGLTPAALVAPAIGRDGAGREIAVAVVQSGAGLQVASVAAMSGARGLGPFALGQALMLFAPVAAAAVALVVFVAGARKRAELVAQKLENVQRHFRLAVDGARAGVWTWRLEQDRIELSPRLQRMLGAPGDVLRVNAFIELASPQDRAALQAAFIQARASGALEASFGVERDGAVRWIEARGVAIEDPELSGGRAVVGTALDVTARREAEQRSQTLERRLKLAIDSYSGPFALYDGRRRLLLWNEAFAQWFQLPPHVLRINASYEAVNAAGHAAIRRERHDPADQSAREIEFVSGRWAQLVERRTGDGGLICVGVDITALKREEQERIRTERELRMSVRELERKEGQNKELARKAEEASRAKSTFLANMSHELRTPLNAIIGFSDIIGSELYGPIGDPRYREYIKDIHASGQLLLDLIKNILDMAKIEAGKFTISPQSVDPVEAVDQAVRILRPRAEQKSLPIVVDAEGLPEIIADPLLLKQMLLNLLSNAVKFTEKGAVMLRGRRVGETIVFQVIDTGRGIPPEHLGRLGKPFEQVDEALSRNHDGTGLGLALTMAFARMHGGRVELDSELGKGTVVSLILPIAMAPPETGPDMASAA